MDNKIKIKKTITKIVLSKEQKEEAENIINNRPFKKTRLVKNRMRSYAYEVTSNRPLSMDSKKRRLNLIYGGRCTICQELPDWKVSYDYDGAARLERFCSSCWKEWQHKI